MVSLWNVRIPPGVRRQLRQLDEDVRLEALRTIEELSEDPFPFDALSMEGYADRRRIRFSFGRFRVVYRVKPRSRTIVITRVGPRETVYLGMLKPGPKKLG